MSSKISIAIFLTSFILCTAIISFVYHRVNNSYQDTFDSYYKSVNQSISDTLRQLDHQSNDTIERVKLLIQQQEDFFETLDDDQLKLYAQTWKVSHLFIIDAKSGKFTGSSAEPSKDFPVNLFDYCAGYRDLASGKRDYYANPLVFGNPEREAYKFFLFPNKKRTKIFQIAINARYLGTTLNEAVQSFSSILSIGFYAPNGDNLGFFSKNSAIGRVDQIEITGKLFPFFENYKDKIVYFTMVPSTVTDDCCECKNHLKGTEYTDFFYVLRTEVSKSELVSLKKYLLLTVVVYDLIATLCSLAIGIYLASGITNKLNFISFKINEIIRSGELTNIQLIGSDEAVQLANNFNRMMNRLKDTREQLLKDERVSTVIRLMQCLAHEVRRPFSLITATLKTLKDSENSNIREKIAKDSLPEIEKALNSVDSLIQDVMTINSTPKLNFKTVDLRELIDFSFREAVRSFPRRDIAIQYDIVIRNKIRIDFLKCQRVFSNIFLNALEAIEPASKIWIKSIQTERNFLEIIIGNSGSFIETDDLWKIFDLFFTNKTRGGTGIGLSICKQIVEAHGGKISCNSNKKQKKVEFTITLPLDNHSIADSSFELPSSTAQITDQLNKYSNETKSQIEDPHEPELIKLIIEKSSSINRTISIGIVDDERTYRDAISGIVESSPILRPRLNIIPFDSANALITFLKSSFLDYLICDIDLGVHSMNGFELVKHLRLTGFLSPICIHSNRLINSDYEKSKEAGAELVLTKPMHRVHLLKFIISSEKEIS